MSFQGDVAGIGLGELLQGLARGGKDGVLTLYGDQLAACLGLRGGLLYLLESPEEDPDEWRERSEQAWIQHPDPELDNERRQTIAHAARMETVFRMLEAGNLHFRFEPGPLPLPTRSRVRRGSSFSVDGEDGGSPWGPGMGVEYVLLEFARISDEDVSGPESPQIFDIPCQESSLPDSEELASFLTHCDGRSTLREIADRLGWTPRATRGVIAELVRQGSVRLATAHELLLSALNEIRDERPLCGAPRMTGFLARSPGGPLPEVEARILYNMWTEGLLKGVWRILKRSQARALARKLDFLDPDPTHMVARWTDLGQITKHDLASRIHGAYLRLSSQDTETQTAAQTELLRISKQLIDNDKVRRAQVLLNAVHESTPSARQTRVELGSRMLEADQSEEGASWLVSVARELIIEEDYDRATQVLRGLLKVAPNNNDAQTLLLETGQRIKRSSARKVRAVVGAAVLAVAATTGVVLFRANEERQDRLVEVTSLLSKPDQGLELLEQYFPGDHSDQVRTLREALMAKRFEQYAQRAAEWMELFRVAEQEITEGDPTTGLKLTIDMPAPPDVGAPHNREFGTRPDLLNLLASRMDADSERLDLPISATEAELEKERLLLARVEQLAELAAAESDRGTYEPFREHVELLGKRIDARMKERSAARAERDQKDLETRQDALLASARFLVQAGELAESLERYEELTSLEGSAELAELLEEEIDRVREQDRALTFALENAAAGQHEVAIAALEEQDMELINFRLPWRIDSRPSGAQVQLPDGRQLRTPFVYESAVGEPIKFTIQHEGTAVQEVVVERPADQMVHLHREPETEWGTGFEERVRQVEALPLPVTGGYIFCDRSGRLWRENRDGEIVWNLPLETLSGIARTPRFLPARPGTLLVLSEDGKAWLVTASSGQVEGTWEHPHPPVDGPQELMSGISVQFQDGTVATWRDRATPETSMARTLLENPDLWDAQDRTERLPHMLGLHSGGIQTPDLKSKWSDWRVEVLNDLIMVRLTGAEDVQFSVRRTGRWHFVAWERPDPLLPDGRLWVSDEGGLRSYRPDR
jgi:hypothetical protein